MKLIAGLILATALVVFGAQNTQSVTFHFLMVDVGPAPVLLAVFAAAIIGAILAWIVSAPGRFRERRHRRDLEHQVAAAQEQLNAAAMELEESRRASRPPPTPPQEQS